MLSPRGRDFALTLHVLSSVGWLGAVLVFLLVAIAGLDADGERARGVYLTMQVIGWQAIVPLCLASLVTGIVQSLGTKWGLIRHYWVVIKLVLTVVATLFLLLHTRPIDELARLAAENRLEVGHAMRVQLVIDAAAALVVLVVATILAVFKPRGMTRYGQRKARAAAPDVR
jgi:uncharacterized membrane protein